LVKDLNNDALASIAENAALGMGGQAGQGFPKGSKQLPPAEVYVSLLYTSFGDACPEIFAIN
jgi:hypothetical protein